MRLSRVVAAIAAVVAVSFGFAVPAQAATTVSITVYVKDNWGALKTGCVTVKSSLKTAKDCTVNSAGAFTFTGLPKATYTISAAGFPNHFDQTLASKPTFSSKTSYATTATLPRYGLIRGTVKSAAGVAIAGAPVRAVLDTNGGPPGPATVVSTKSDGTYELYAPADGYYTVTVGPVVGFGTWPRDTGVQLLTEAKRNTTSTVNASMEPAGTLVGTILAPPTITATDLCVSVHSRSAGTLRGSACGHAGDSFAIPDLRPQSYVVCVGASPAPQTCTGDTPGVRELVGETSAFYYVESNPSAIDLASGTTADATPKWGGTVHVTIPLDNGAVVRDGCLGLQDATRGVSLQDCAPVDGVFTFNVPVDLESTAQQVSLTGASNAPDTAWTVWLKLSGGRVVSVQPFPRAKSQGSSTIHVTIGGVEAAALEPACAVLLVWSLPTTAFVRERNCDVTPSLTFDQLAAGTYSVEIVGAAGSFAEWWAPGFAGPLTSAAKIVIDDSQTLGVPMTIPTTQRIRGTVNDVDGTPRSDGTVQFVAGESVLASAVPASDGSYELEAPIAEGAVRLHGFGNAADQWYVNSPTKGSAYPVGGPATTGDITGVNFTVRPAATISGTLDVPSSFAGTSGCVYVVQAGRESRGAVGSYCGEAGDSFAIPVLAANSYSLCVHESATSAPCSGSDASWEDVGAPTSFTVPAAGGDLPVDVAFGGTLLVTPTSTDVTAVDGGCAALVVGGATVDSTCTRTGGAFSLAWGDDIGDRDGATIEITGLAAARDSVFDVGALDAGRTVTKTVSPLKWARFAGTITRPAGFESATVCAVVTNFAGVFKTDCALPGDSSYSIAMPPGWYKVQFYAQGAGVAAEWYPNKVAGDEGEWLHLDFFDMHVSATLAPGGIITGVVLGPGGTPATGGCVSAYTLTGLFVDAMCPDDGAPYVFDSLIPGYYMFKFSGFEGLGSQWSTALKAGVSGRVRAVAGATTTFNADLAAAASITGTVTYMGAPASGGCVDAYDSRGNLVSTACVNDEGAYAIDDAPVGQLYLLFRDFDGAANEWSGDAVAYSGARSVRTTATSATVVDADLARGGSISGAVPGASAYPLTVYLRSWDGAVVQTASLSPDDYDGPFTFEHVPAGRYKLTVRMDGHSYESPYMTSGSRSPAVLTLPQGANWSLTGLTWSADFDMRGGIAGTLNVPSSWKSTTVCALAITPKGAMQSADCGPRGGRFELPLLSPDLPYTILFTNGDVRSSTQLKAFKGAKLYYGNTTSLGNALFYTTSVNSSPYLPVWFYSDVNYKTAHYEAIQWMGDIGAYPSTGKFLPESTMTRSSFALYLYRIAGSPPVTLPSKSPFTDVKSTDAAYKALLWMRATKVWTSTTFKPTAALDKRTEALILYRAAGSPSVALPSKNPYTDIKSSDAAYKAVVWANKYKIVAKTSNSTYGVTSTVKRKYAAASLYAWWWY